MIIIINTNLNFEVIVSLNRIKMLGCTYQIIYFQELINFLPDLNNYYVY